MGRKQRIVSAEKEKEKIKNSILEVFRSRLRSPGGGGAIVVGKSNKESDKQHILPKIADEELGGNTCTSSSSMSEKDTRHSYKCSQKKKRRRVKSKTNHTKKLEKEKKDITRNIRMALKPGTSKEDSFRKISVITHNRLTTGNPPDNVSGKVLKLASHLQKLPELTGRPAGFAISVVIRQRNEVCTLMSLIEANKLGLFNPGKKSETISREISVSDAVKRKTQEDLKRILHHDDNDEEESNHLMDFHHNSPPRLKSLNHTKKDIGYFSRSSIHSLVTPLSPHNRSTSCVSIGSIESEDGLHTLPKTPPYEETAEFLISALKPKIFFPGRNLFQETIEELQTIMKISTPVSATPLSGNTVKKRIALNSVKCSLLERYLPSASSTISENISMQVEEPSILKHEQTFRLSNTAKPSTVSKSNIENDRNKEIIIEINDTEHRDLACNHCDVEHGTSIQGGMKMNYTLKSHDMFNLKDETKCTEQQARNKCSDILYSNCRMETKNKTTESYYKLETEMNNDGRSLLKSNDVAAINSGSSLLKCNDKAAMVNMSLDKPQIYCRPMELDHYKSASNDNQRHTDKLLEAANRGYNNNTLSHFIVPIDTYTSYHENYVSSNHRSKSPGYKRSQSPNLTIFPVQRSTSSENEGMKSNWQMRAHSEYMPTCHSDFYAPDRNAYSGMDTLTSAEIKSMDMLDLLDHDSTVQMAERRITTSRLKSTTPDSDGSPLWLPTEELLKLPFKPNLENLSPSKKLYPRRLY